MTPSPFLIQLVILLLPGVIWAYLASHFPRKANVNQVEFLIRSLLFGMASYAVTYVIYVVLGWQFAFVDFNQASEANVITQAIAWQIGIATGVGVLLALAWIYAANYKLLVRLLQSIKATKTYGDEDVWDYVFTSGAPETTYVHYRDLQNRIVYAGWVDAFSETGRVRELMLRNAKIYDFDGSLLFDTPRVYICREAEGMHIEFPAGQENIGAATETPEVEP